MTPSDRAQWQKAASCHSMHPSVFYVDRGDSERVAAAKAICEGCPVRLECLEYGLKEAHGVWGGLTERERRKVRRTRRLEPVHGVRARYQRGCRCPACTTTNTRYAKRRRVG